MKELDLIDPEIRMSGKQIEYDERSQISYAVILVIIMAAVQMAPGLYIGARSICVLLGGDTVQQENVDASEGDAQAATKHRVNYSDYMSFYERNAT